MTPTHKQFERASKALESCSRAAHASGSAEASGDLLAVRIWLDSKALRAHWESRPDEASKIRGATAHVKLCAPEEDGYYRSEGNEDLAHYMRFLSRAGVFHITADHSPDVLSGRFKE